MCRAQHDEELRGHGLAGQRGTHDRGTDGTTNTFPFLGLMNYAFHGRTDFGYGSNPFFFVNEAGQGYVSGSTNGTVAGTWMPNDETSNHRGAESDHSPGGVFAAMADGRVTWVPNSVSPAVYLAAFTRRR